MTTAEVDCLPLHDVGQIFNAIPLYVLRRFIDRRGLAEPRSYPGQHRSIRADRLPELRRQLREAGYPA
jgi:hypothetical protein